MDLNMAIKVFLFFILNAKETAKFLNMAFGANLERFFHN